MALGYFRKHERALDAALVGTFVFVALVLRLIGYASLVAYPDEFVYTHRALATLGYNWAWSPAFMLDQPPLYMYILTVLTVFVNSQLDTFRLVSVLSGAVTVGFVYLLAKAIFTRRTGVIAAVLFAFNGFHILYSRLAQQEALTILLMTASLYFFWTGVAGRKNLKRAVAGGIFLGLAVDTKYVALVLPLVYMLYLFVGGQDWRNFRLVKREWWALILSKELGALFLTAFLVFFPVFYVLFINGIDALYFDLLGKFIIGYSPFFRAFNVQDLVLAALASYTNVLAFVSTFDSPNVFYIYELYADVTFVSLVVVLLYHLRAFLKQRPRETFLLLLFGITGLIFLIYPNRFQYYELYTFPAYPIMFAYVLERATSRLTITSRLSSVRPSVLFSFIVLFLTLSTGVAAGISSSQYGHGAFDQLAPFFQYVKEHHETNLTIAATPIGNVGYISYYLRRLNVSATILSLAGAASAADPLSTRLLEVPIQRLGIFRAVVTLQPLTIFHPQYVVLTQAEYADTFTTAMKLFLAQNYRQVSISQGFMLLQRIGS